MSYANGSNQRPVSRFSVTPPSTRRLNNLPRAASPSTPQYLFSNSPKRPSPTRPRLSPLTISRYGERVTIYQGVNRPPTLVMRMSDTFPSPQTLLASTSINTGKSPFFANPSKPSGPKSTGPLSSTYTGTVVDSKLGTSSPDPSSGMKLRDSTAIWHTHYKQQTSFGSGDVPIITSTMRPRERVFSASSLASDSGEIVRSLSNRFSGLPPRITGKYRGSMVLGAVADDSEASEELLARQKSGSTTNSGTSRVSRGGSARRKPPPALRDSMLSPGPGPRPGPGTTQTLSPPPDSPSVFSTNEEEWGRQNDGTADFDPRDNRRSSIALSSEHVNWSQVANGARAAGNRDSIRASGQWATVAVPLSPSDVQSVTSGQSGRTPIDVNRYRVSKSAPTRTPLSAEALAARGVYMPSSAVGFVKPGSSPLSVPPMGSSVSPPQQSVLTRSSKSSHTNTLDIEWLSNPSMPHETEATTANAVEKGASSRGSSASRGTRSSAGIGGRPTVTMVRGVSVGQVPRRKTPTPTNTMFSRGSIAAEVETPSPTSTGSMSARGEFPFDSQYSLNAGAEGGMGVGVGSRKRSATTGSGAGTARLQRKDSEVLGDEDREMVRRSWLGRSVRASAIIP